MITVHSIEELHTFISQEQKSGKTIGFVPTMGALHDGHLSLVEMSKKHGHSTVMSIFVNPTQFGPNEDFEKYPRSLDTDKNMAAFAGVNVLFAPSVHTIYPTQDKHYIDPPAQMNNVLCGPFRPGHFRGVCTVVHRLLEIVQPNEMFLGQKDGQQLRILQETMKSLHPNIKITGVPTKRESSGLAMSSRNKYLTEKEKQQALILFKALSAGLQTYRSGEKSSEKIIHAAHRILETESEFKIQYLELVRWSDFSKPESVLDKSMLAIAGYIGTTRLIDNIILE